MKPRYYQEEAINATINDIKQGGDSGLLAMATGTGKTVVMANIANQFKGRMLFLAHRERLIEQMADTIERVTGEPVAVEMGSSRAHDSLARITIASVQSIGRKNRRQMYDPNHFKLVAIDEAHRAAADGHLRVIDHFPNAYKLGVTATPERTDSKKLPFSKILYEYRLTKAVEDGYLCPIKAELIPIRIDMSSVRVKMGDFQDKGIDEALIPYLDRISTEIAMRRGKHIVFLPLIKTSKAMTDMLNMKGLKTVHIDGTMNNVGDTIKQYEQGDYDCICNSLIFTEGVDIPCIDHVTNLRITKSRTTYCQIIGRGTRFHPNKKHLTVLDFFWHTKRHRLCTPASLVADSDEEEDRINKAMRKRGRVDVCEEIKDAKTSIEREVSKHSYKARESIDPLKHYGVDADEYEELYEWQKQPPSPAQIEFLSRHSIKADNWTKGLASHVIDGIKSHNGLTYKQNKFLTSRGINTKGLSFDQASSMIEEEMRKIKNIKRWAAPR